MLTAATVAKQLGISRTLVYALAALRFRKAPAGWRWVARACQVCRGWHSELVKGQM